MHSVATLAAGRVLPPRVAEVLSRLQAIYGSDLVITRVTASEVDFRSRSMTDSAMIRDMMPRKDAIFGSALAVSGPGCFLGPADFQVLAEQNSTGGQPGLCLRYLPNIANRQQYLAGFWFY